MIEWNEFVQIVQKIKLKDQRRKSKAIDLKGLGAAEVVEGQGGGSIYLREEVSVLARVFNNLLKNEAALVDRIPIDDSNDDLFNTCSDGLVLIYTLKIIDPTLIDMRKVCQGDNLNVF